VRARRPLLLAAALTALLTVAPATARAPKFKTPKSGLYDGTAGPQRNVTVYVVAKSVSLVAFDFTCGQTSGRTALNDIRVFKTRRGYQFSLDAHGNVTYADEQPDENAAVYVFGRFTRSGRALSGRLRVKTPRCGNSGSVRWSARKP
jgi:hypothetical protein